MYIIGYEPINVDKGEGDRPDSFQCSCVKDFWNITFQCSCVNDLLLRLTPYPEAQRPNQSHKCFLHLKGNTEGTLGCLKGSAPILELSLGGGGKDENIPPSTSWDAAYPLDLGRDQPSRGTTTGQAPHCDWPHILEHQSWEPPPLDRRSVSREVCVGHVPGRLSSMTMGLEYVRNKARKDINPLHWRRKRQWGTAREGTSYGPLTQSSHLGGGGDIMIVTHRTTKWKYVLVQTVR